MKEEIKLNPECVICLANKYLGKEPVQLDIKQRTEYYQAVLNLIANSPLYMSAPEIVTEVSKLQKNMLGVEDDYTDIKKHFNALMLSKEDETSEIINNSDDSLYAALQYSLLGNYIDFGAMDAVDEGKLDELFSGASDINIDREEYNNLKKDLEKAKRLVFLTDNCGEIALDKILIGTIKSIYTDIKIDVLVRGKDVLNDATLEDAKQVGLDKLVNVFSNGSDVAGTCYDKLSDEARALIDAADVLIAKGQGNFETMRYCGKNVYYMFLCKCKMFAERFEVPRFSPMLLNDTRMG